MRIDDRDPCVCESLLDRRRRRLAIAQLFTNALKDQHVRVHAHTDRQDHTGYAGQSKRRAEVPHESEQDDEVQDQGQIRIDARAAVVNQHEDQHCEQADHSCHHAVADRVSTERWANRALFEVANTRRQRA